MSEIIDIRGYVNPAIPGETEAGQRAGMTRGIEIYVEDKFGKQIDALLKSIRKGSIVEVKELYCLAPATGTPGKRRRILTERVEAIKERGGTIREWSTGYVSRGRMARMSLLAYEQIATSGRARSRPKTGRPLTWDLTPQETMTIAQIWASRRYKNDNERRVAVEKNTGRRMSRSWLRLRFGSPHKEVDPNTEPQAVPVKRGARKRASFVYFVRDDGKIKIGRSVQPKARIKSLETHTKYKVLLTIRGGHKREGALHKRFARYRVEGTKEWFHAMPELLKFIAGLKRRQSR